MKKIIYLFLFLSCFFAMFLFRAAYLDRSPESVGFDEASLGYNAYSILLTGKDEYGTPHPLSLRSYNDFKPALYVYLTIPFVRAFGLNDSSIRLASAFFGTISLIFLFFILRNLGKPRSVLFDVLLVTYISFLPWRLHFSRVALESNVSMAFFTGMVWCLINYTRNIFYKSGLIVFSILSIYSYHSSRLAVPLMLLLYLIDPLKNNLLNLIKKPRQLIVKLLPVIIVIISYIPLFFEAAASSILTRYTQTNLFSHFYPFTPSEIANKSNVWLTFLGNPMYFLGDYVVGHFISYLSPRNLSLTIYPGVIKSAQAIGGSGMMGPFAGILFVVGLFTNIKNVFTDERLKFLIYWFLSGVAPAAITWEWFYPLRSLNIYPLIDIIVIFGLILIITFILKIRKRAVRLILVLAIGGILGVSCLYNLQNEYGFASWQTAGEFQPGGFKQGSEILNTLKDKYKVIYLDTNQAQSYELFWYYMKLDPLKVQALATTRNKPGEEGSATLNFANFVYKKFDWPKDQKLRSVVFWTNSEVKEEEIAKISGAKLIKILNPRNEWIASIIIKD